METLPSGFERLNVFNPPNSQQTTHGPLAPNGIQAFRHTASQLRVILFSAPGPLVSATIIVGTQPISDAGHPHTLEHIVFLGSQNHPERGYLDNLACRCIADGTNAWTDNEYTAYTTITAGFEGFAHLLPAFLDHILRPNINEATFDSEVYHIRADGKEAGVVFCEMQARENTEADLADRVIRATLLNGTPLAYDSGGLCKQIRTLTNEDIARFHRDQYCGANVSVVVGGSDVNPTQLLTSVKPLLDDISSRPGYEPGYPQWQKPLNLKPLPPVTKKVVPFPCPDQDIGTVMLGWRGPPATERHINMALDVLLRYLAGDIWAPFPQHFVEVEDQVASDIYYTQETFLNVSTLSISFAGVQHLDEDDADESDEENGDDHLAAEQNGKHDPMDTTDNEDEQTELEEDSFLTSGKLEAKAMNILSEIVRTGELPGGVAAIRAAIKKEKESQLSELESGSHEAVPYHLIEEVVYGSIPSMPVGEETRGFLTKYDDLMAKDESYWTNLLRDWFVEAPRVEVVMVPDAELGETLAEGEKRAESDRVASLGKDTLAKLGKLSEDRINSLKAGKFDESRFPPMPSSTNISRWPYSVSQERSTHYFSQSVSLESDFVQCTIFLDTQRLTFGQRAFLSFLCELVPTCDILLEDGTYVPYTDNARAISEATTSSDHSGIFLGYTNSLAHHCLAIHFVSTPESFEESASLMLQTFFQSEVTSERVSAMSQSLVANATSEMRDGSSVLEAAATLVPFLEGNRQDTEGLPNFALSCFMGTHQLLSFVSDAFTRKKPKKQVQRKVIKKMHESLNALRRLPSSDVFVQITARNPQVAHQTFTSLWKEKRNRVAMEIPNRGINAGSMEVDGPLPLTRRAKAALQKLIGERTIGRIIGINGVESSSVDIRVDCAVYNGHADWAPLTVLTEMLCRMEGPLSNAVRGAGLAYGVQIVNAKWRGHLVASIYESSSPAAAWDAVFKSLQEFRKELDLDPRESGQDVDLQTARAATLFSLNRGRSTPESIGMGALSRAAMAAPASPLADQLVEESVEKVSHNMLAGVFDRHIARLFDDRGRVVVVTCGKGVVQETISSFSKCIAPLPLMESSIDSLFPPEVRTIVAELKRG